MSAPDADALRLDLRAGEDRSYCSALSRSSGGTDPTDPVFHPSNGRTYGIPSPVNLKRSSMCPGRSEVDETQTCPTTIAFSLRKPARHTQE